MFQRHCANAICKIGVRSLGWCAWDRRDSWGVGPMGTSATPTDAAAREKLLKVFEHPHILLHGDPSQVVLFVAAPTATRVSRVVSGLGRF